MPTTCFLPDSELERLLLEDVPYFDLTTELLGVGREPGGIRFATRQKTVLACTEEAVRLLDKAGCVGGKCLPSGTTVNAGETIVDATGDAAALHMGWKVTANLLESACGIAGRTRRIVR